MTAHAPKDDDRISARRRRDWLQLAYGMFAGALVAHGVALWSTDASVHFGLRVFYALGAAGFGIASQWMLRRLQRLEQRSDA